MIGRAALAVALLALPAGAETLRIATFDAELARRGPGLLLRDISAGKDAQVAAVVAVIATVRPDVLALQGFDWDHDGVALGALAERLSEAGADYPHRVALRPNTGMATGIDLDGDGFDDGAGDAQGFGRFTGEGGMAVLSRLPVAAVTDFSEMLWRDLPGALLPSYPDGAPFPSGAAQAVQRLSSTGHWAVTLEAESGPLGLLTFRAGPPVFDGPEDRNGRRNHDEIVFWRHWMDGAFGAVPERFVIAGNANLDPVDSDGRREAIAGLLGDPRLLDTVPAGAKGTDTVDWGEIGQYRVDYVLPSRGLRVVGAGVHWPEPGTPEHEAAITASRHRMVWVDLELE
ncbi:MAG: endonuclease/exonuclease/phosphatase family protein [Pseudooceanicola sp.]|nr:endonuclease/exonuclease/phosphatase family protein [Pseudooceanicola sp.]